MKDQVFVDTSALYAYINVKDPDHKKIEGFLNSFKGRVLITNYIFDEIVTLVLARLGHSKAVFVGDILQKSPQVDRIWVTPVDEKKAWGLFVSREDKAYSFTDCVSFAVMNRLGISNCIALDGHFRQEGFVEL
jgi:hypothetical protein